MDVFLKKVDYFLLFLCGILFSCTDKEEEQIINEELPYLEIDNNVVNFKEEAGNRIVRVKFNGDYSVNVVEGNDWCDAVVLSDGIEISVTKNEDKQVRNAVVEVVFKTLKSVIEVSQLGWGKAILLSPKFVELNYLGGEIGIDVTTNIDYEYQIGESWIKGKPKSRSEEHPLVTTSHSFVAEVNKSAVRETFIRFYDKEAETDIKEVVFQVKQKGYGDYEPEDPDNIEDDIMIKVKEGKASSTSNTAYIEKSFDGDYNTMYHSNSLSEDNPVVLEYYFENSSDMDYLVYHPRRTGARYGDFGETKIYVKKEKSTDWEHLLDYNFKFSTSPTKVTFPEAQIGIIGVKFIVKTGSNDLAACSEMEFYKKNPNNFDYKDLFEDKACTTLKPGITEKEILECKYSFYKNIAYRLFHNEYPKEFRIAKFNAYPNPNVESKKNKIAYPYSLLDNPTGIFAPKDAIFVILADLNGISSPVKVCVQNLKKGFKGKEYSLSDGVNNIKIEEEGLMYVLYHEEDFENSPEITLHFASGKVNGYFDSQNPSHNGRSNELLSKAVDKHFDVVGKYAHLTFPIDRFKNHTSDLSKLIDIYDKIVYHQQELLGLCKYKRMFNNRMYFHVVYDNTYMMATYNRTIYNDNTLSSICDIDKLSTDAIWGPSHEVGHSNQTNGLKWIGMTEVTNNIMAEYIQTNIMNQPSRVQTENIKNRNRYTMAWDSILVCSKPHPKEKEVFSKLIPFWQLQLYFGNVLGMTPDIDSDNPNEKGGFYPDVYEHLRTKDVSSDNGKQQLEFVYIASLKSGYNLTDFFEKWGFLTPVDVVLNDYGEGRLTVTDAMITDVKNRINNLPFLKLENIPLEYITDNNWKTFKEKKGIIKGTSSRSDNIITLTGWQNVIVFEVREDSKKGKLVHVTEGKFEPSDVAILRLSNGWKDNYKVYAVQYDNERVQVELM